MPIQRHRLACLHRLASCPACHAVRAEPNTSARSAAAEPGRFDYYVLVLGWSPSYCATRRQRSGATGNATPRSPARLRPARALAAERRGVAGRLCRMRKRPWVPQSVIDEMPRHHAEQEPDHPRIPRPRHLLRSRAGAIFRACARPLRAHHHPAALPGRRPPAGALTGARSRPSSSRPIRGSSRA